MDNAYTFCVKALAVEAAALVLAGWIAGMVFGTWTAVIAAQLLLYGCAWVGYRIEGHLHLRRSVAGLDRWRGDGQ
jgi:hypothetical protein